MKITYSVIGLALLAYGASFTGSASAADAFPTKPVSIVVPFAVGGPTDTSARVVANALAKALNTSFVVENVAGAGATIGSTKVAQSRPDGYTLLWGTSSSLAIAPHIYKNLRYDPVSSFAPISTVATGPFILAAKPSLDANSVDQLVAQAKAEPGKLNFASTGRGGSTHLTAELFSSVTGINALHVPYNGGAPAMNALLAGDVDYLFDTPTTIVPMAKAGRIKALAVTSDTRWAGLPEVKTMQELGFKGFDSSTWFGLLAPAGTPDPILDKLNDATIAVLKDPAVISALETAGFAVTSSTRQQFADRIATDGGKWGTVIQSLDLEQK